MADVPQIALKEFFKLFAPTYVLGTTYTLSLAFFERLVYPEIKRSQLRRFLIRCDNLGFQRATIESSALRSVGREYMATCAPTPGDAGFGHLKARPEISPPTAGLRVFFFSALVR